MPGNCVAPGCSSTQLSVYRYSFHSFPNKARYPELRREWTERLVSAYANAGSSQLPPSVLRQATPRLCEMHFRLEDYCRPDVQSFQKGQQIKRRRLRVDAVPFFESQSQTQRKKPEGLDLASKEQEKSFHQEKRSEDMNIHIEEVEPSKSEGSKPDIDSSQHHEFPKKIEEKSEPVEQSTSNTYAESKQDPKMEVKGEKLPSQEQKNEIPDENIILTENGLYQCAICLKCTKRRYDIRRHILTHSKGRDRPHVCHHCGHTYLTASHLRQHLQSHDTTRPHKCDPCGKSYSRSSELLRHRALVHKVNLPKPTTDSDNPVPEYKCIDCSKTFETRYLLKKHRIKKHMSKCKHCKTLFRTSSGLKSHMALKHKDIFCPECNMEFKNLKLLMHHNNQEHPGEGRNKPWLTHICTVCGKGFYTEEMRNWHMVTHMQRDKNFSCSVCHKRFVVEGNLKRHFLRYHTNDRKISCSVCQKEFKTEGKLQRHFLHKHRVKTQYQCTVCRKTFDQKHKLKQHLAFHNAKPPKPFQCDKCHKGFFVDYLLRIHHIEHSIAESTQERIKTVNMNNRSLNPDQDVPQNNDNEFVSRKEEQHCAEIDDGYVKYTSSESQQGEGGREEGEQDRDVSPDDKSSHDNIYIIESIKEEPASPKIDDGFIPSDREDEDEEGGEGDFFPDKENSQVNAFVIGSIKEEPASPKIYDGFIPSDRDDADEEEGEGIFFPDKETSQVNAFVIGSIKEEPASPKSDDGFIPSYRDDADEERGEGDFFPDKETSQVNAFVIGSIKEKPAIPRIDDGLEKYFPSDKEDVEEEGGRKGGEEDFFPDKETSQDNAFVIGSIKEEPASPNIDDGLEKCFPREDADEEGGTKEGEGDLFPEEKSSQINAFETLSIKEEPSSPIIDDGFEKCVTSKSELDGGGGRTVSLKILDVVIKEEPSSSPEYDNWVDKCTTSVCEREGERRGRKRKSKEEKRKRENRDLFF